MAAAPIEDFLDAAEDNFDRHHGQVIVIKFGGEIYDDAEKRALLLRKTRMVRLFGAIPILVNGGAKQINDLCDERGIEKKFDQGERVCNLPVLRASVDALSRVTQNISAEYNALCKGKGHDMTAVGMSAHSIITARPKKEGSYTGDVISVDAKKLKSMIRKNPDRLLIFNSICRNGSLRNGLLNVNADNVAAELAIAAAATRLILCTNTPGVLNGEKQPISKTNPTEIKKMIRMGVITDGMIPKVNALLNAVEHGVEAAVILDPSGLVPELFTPEGAGTMIMDGARTTLRRPALSA